MKIYEDIPFKNIFLVSVLPHFLILILTTVTNIVLNFSFFITALYYTRQCYTVLRYAALFYTVLYHAVLYYTILTILH